MKRHRALWLLGGLFVGLAALVYLDGRRPSVEEVRTRGERIASRLKREEITSLEISSPRARVRLERAVSGFVQVDPSGQRRVVDEGKIEGLLFALEVGSILRQVPGLSETERAALGLSAPRIVLVVTTRSKEGMLTLRFGADAPSGGVYASRNQESAVLVVERRLYELAESVGAPAPMGDGGK